MVPARGLLALAQRHPFGLLGLLTLALGAVACARSFDQEGAVHVLTVDGVINPVTARYVDRGIDSAEDAGAAAIVLRLDTPGGLVDSMRDIVRRINRSEVPVITYVWPSGGRAASAGTFITMAGHVAAMAPGTNIGAASPVSGSGEDIDETLERKVTNDLAAFARSIAAERGRNAEWAEQAVREAVSASEREAIDLDIVDFIADDLADLIAQSEGRTVALPQGNSVLHVRDAPVVEDDMTLVERFLVILSDPNIAFILLTIGMTAIIFELLNPGVILPGVVGVLALILAFFSLGTLPVNWAGVALIILAFALLVAEVLVAGFGALGLGGIVALILGGLILTTSGDPDFRVSRWLIYGMAAGMGVFFLMVLSTLIRTRRLPATTGSQAMIGKRAVARSALDPDGFVFLNGERWRATVQGGPVQDGEPVTVVGVKGLRLTVKSAAGGGEVSAEGEVPSVGETGPSKSQPTAMSGEEGA